MQEYRLGSGLLELLTLITYFCTYQTIYIKFFNRLLFTFSIISTNTNRAHVQYLLTKFSIHCTAGSNLEFFRQYECNLAVLHLSNQTVKVLLSEILPDQCELFPEKQYVKKYKEHSSFGN